MKKTGRESNRILNMKIEGRKSFFTIAIKGATNQAGIIIIEPNSKKIKRYFCEKA